MSYRAAISDARYTGGMNMDALSRVLDLPVPERIKAVQAIWDSVAGRPGQVPVSPRNRGLSSSSG